MIRVMTYNIRRGLGTDGIRSVRRIAEVAADESPDILCLQEVNQRVQRSWLANQPKYFSTRLGMQAVFQRNIRYGVGGYGNCTLSAHPIRWCRCHPLPGEGEPRGVLELSVQIGDESVTIFNTHLSTEREVRIEQSSAVLEIARSVTGPKILCGDLNDTPDSRPLAVILDEPVLRDSALEIQDGDRPTWKDKRIDFVLADLRFRVISCKVIESRASDHYPLAVDLELT